MLKQQLLKNELQKPIYAPKLAEITLAADEAGRAAVYRQLAKMLNKPVAPRKEKRKTLGVAELAAVIDASEFAALSPAKANQFAVVVAMADRANPADVTRLTSAIFGAGATSTALNADIDVVETLAQSLGITSGEISYWHICRALNNVNEEDNTDA